MGRCRRAAASVRRMPPDTPPKKTSWSWRSRAFRGLIYQVVAIAVIALVVWFLASNTQTNMRVRGIQSGFDFLGQPAGFCIGESLFPFDSGESYWRAFAVGLTNTLRVAIAGIFFATILGTLIGVGRLLAQCLGARRVLGLCGGVPQHSGAAATPDVVPDPDGTAAADPGRLEARGLFPEQGRGELSDSGLGGRAGVGCCRAAGRAWSLAWIYRRWVRRQFELTGRRRSLFLTPVAIVILGGTGGLGSGRRTHPAGRAAQGRVRRRKRWFVDPEFLALLLGLSMYTAAFIAEVVRSGIASVPAARARPLPPSGWTVAWRSGWCCCRRRCG